jgi:hypothetical protein
VSFRAFLNGATGPRVGEMRKPEAISLRYKASDRLSWRVIKLTSLRLIQALAILATSFLETCPLTLLVIFRTLGVSLWCFIPAIFFILTPTTGHIKPLLVLFAHLAERRSGDALVLTLLSSGPMMTKIQRELELMSGAVAKRLKYVASG